MHWRAREKPTDAREIPTYFASRVRGKLSREVPIKLFMEWQKQEDNQ
jgi:hypothetical protein